MQRALEDLGPQAEGAVEAAVQCFGNRLEGLLAQSLDELLRCQLRLQFGRRNGGQPARGPARSADELEALLRSGFKSLGCATVAVLDRCRLGDRGVSAELPGGVWIQAWISGGSVLWVIPSIPQLSELVRDPALATPVLASLLEYGAGRKESFFLSQHPLSVGYKFGPLHPEVLFSPAALGGQLDDALTMVQQQARIIALESRVASSSRGLGGGARSLPSGAGVAAAAPAAVAAPEPAFREAPRPEPAAGEPSPGPSLGQAASRDASRRAEEAVPSRASQAEAPGTEPVRHPVEAPPAAGQELLQEAVRAAAGGAAARLAASAAAEAAAPQPRSVAAEAAVAEEVGRVAAPPGAAGAAVAEATAAEPRSAVAEEADAEEVGRAAAPLGGAGAAAAEATAAQPRSAVAEAAVIKEEGREASPPVGAGAAPEERRASPAASSTAAETSEAVGAPAVAAVHPVMEEWFERVLSHYLEPYAVSGTREWPFQISIQDTPARRVGMHFINKTHMNFSHFVENVEEYKRAARAQGFEMDVLPHTKGHQRLKIWQEEEGGVAEGNDVAEGAVESGPAQRASQPTAAILGGGTPEGSPKESDSSSSRSISGESADAQPSTVGEEEPQMVKAAAAAQSAPAAAAAAQPAPAAGEAAPAPSLGAEERAPEKAAAEPAAKAAEPAAKAAEPAAKAAEPAAKAASPTARRRARVDIFAGC